MEKQMNVMGWMRGVILCGMLTACATSAQTPAQQAQSGRVKIAQAKFEEHCKSAGEKIYKTVEGVEGVFLMKLRPEKINFGNQFEMDDPYGRDLAGDGYLHTFLRGSRPSIKNWQAGWPRYLGYSYVEAVDPKDGQRYRYTGAWKNVLKTSSIMQGGDGKSQFYSNEFVLDKTPAENPAPRYGVTYDDISTREDREYWIAGSSLRVIDLQTSEVMAERIGYMWDPVQGSVGGGRSPWLLAADYACPDFNRNVKNSPVHAPGASAQARQTQEFVEKILIPKLDK